MKRHQDICWLCHLEHAPDNRILTILFINPFYQPFFKAQNLAWIMRTMR